MAKAKNELTIENIGPIDKLTIPVPEDGGVVVLHGPNGTGKTQGLEATQALLRGKGSLDCRDGQVRGVMAGFGVKITVGRTARRTGELQALHLEQRLDVADLVDPRVKDPEAADARRIKALVNVQGVKADPAMFYDLLGGEETFCGLVGAIAANGGDLVEMASGVKRCIEVVARDEESQATRAEGEAAGCKGAIGDLDMSAEDDAEELQSHLEASITHDAEVKSRRESGMTARQNATEAHASLEKARTSHAGPTLEQAVAEAKAAGVAHDKALGQLGEAQAHEAQCGLLCKAATDRRDVAMQYENDVVILTDIVDKAANADVPTELHMADAAAKVTDAREGVEQGALIRSAKEKLVAVEVFKSSATEHHEEAKSLRKAAAGVDGVLSKAIGSGPLRVEAGRMVTETTRGTTFFADLSPGERWRIVLGLAAERVGEGGLVVVPQEAWEGLDPDNRMAVAADAKRLKVVVLTAESDMGELSADEYLGEKS